MARILLDAMGGDQAPAEIVAGAVEAAPMLKHDIVLIGDPAAISLHLPKPCPPNIHIHATSEVIGMCEKPIEAIRKKKDSSIVVGVDLVKQGEGDVFVSAGNTGACSAASLLAWRQMPGFHRPAIASEFPNYHGRLLLLDAGASPDIDPEQLVEFAIMGRAYANLVMGRANPRVWLLNMGEEEGKGNLFAKTAYQILAKHEWFAGNIESKDMFDQPIDVVVCDAFVGNIVLKTAEGVAEIIMRMIKDQVPSGLGALPYAPLKKLFRPLREKMDYAEYGGSPLLGLNHLTIICHGRSNAKAIKNALLLAQKAVDMGLLAKIRESVALELPG
ncbi:MAG: phosphate acyltransferase PlsX [Fimbriimonadaceae bacterium]